MRSVVLPAVSGLLAWLVFATVAVPGSSAGRERRIPGTLSPAAPQFFATVVSFAEGNGPLEIRDSSTGAVVGEYEPGTERVEAPVSAVAAAGVRSFVIGVPAAHGCSTQLERVAVDVAGRPGQASPIGRPLRGRVWSLASSAGGGVVGYAVSGCAKGDPGFLGVLDVTTGRSRRWSDVSLGGVSFGNLALADPLAMSADGRQLAFAAAVISRPPYGAITAQEIRILLTDARVGTLFARSAVVLRAPARASLTAAGISPDGRTLYLCSQSSTTTTDRAQLAARSITTGTSTVLASFHVTRDGVLRTVQCSNAALDPTGRFLLLPSQLDRSSASGPVTVHMAALTIATGARSTFALTLPATGGMDPVAGLLAAW
jgi:hypothetical protein